MREWREEPLGSIIASGKAELQTGPFGTMIKASEYSKVGTPLIAVQDIGNNRLHPHKVNYIPPETVSRLQRYKVIQGDIIFGRKGAVDRRAIVTKDEEGWIQGSDCIRLRFKDEIDSLFVSYQLGSPSLRDWLVQHAHGATMPSLNQEILSLLPILLPPLPEQKAIASVLSSLDDKIDLLHRQNKTLEAMAETLFRQWFVEEADESWEEGKLGDVVTVVSGTTPKTDNPEFWNGDIHWTSPRDITNLNGLFLFDTERKITRKGLDQIGSGLLPANSLLMSSRAPVGALAFSEIPVAINQGYAGIVCNKGYSREFIYLWLKSNMDHVQSHANGSTFQEISKSTFRELDITIPNSYTLTEFQKTIGPLFVKIRANSIQIKTLEKLRDTLLPKLMSGEVRVKV